jgi:hypothetical protein
MDRLSKVTASQELLKVRKSRMISHFARHARLTASIENRYRQSPWKIEDTPRCGGIEKGKRDCQEVEGRCCV